MGKYLALIFSVGFVLSQNEGVIYSTLADTTFGNTYSTIKINPEGLEVEIILPSLRFQDVSFDESKILLNNSDSIFIYDFESLNNLNINGTTALFTYYEEFIILHSEDKIIRYSLEDSSESLILDSMVTFVGGPPWIPKSLFILSPDKKDVISLRKVADSLEIILSNIQNIEQTTIRTISYTNYGFYWREDDYLYYTDEHLYKFNIFNANEPIIQLTSETYDYILTTNDKYLDKIILAKDEELWLYNFIDNQVSLLGELENGTENGFDTFHEALRQTWSPDNQKVAIGTLMCVPLVRPGDIIIYNTSTGSNSIIQENTYRNNLFWHGDSEEQVAIENINVSFRGSLDDAYPNPFNPITNINYELNRDAHVKLSVYDVLGNLVKNLVNEQKLVGNNSVNWDSTNKHGQKVSAGVYLYSIESGDFRQTKKMILLK